MNHDEQPMAEATDISEAARERLEKIGEMREWLERKVGDLKSDTLEEIFLFVQGVSEMEKESRLGRGESDADVELTFNDLMKYHPEPFFGSEVQSFYWLMTDDGGFIKDLPIKDAAEVLEDVAASRVRVELRNEARTLGRNKMQREVKNAA